MDFADANPLQYRRNKYELDMRKLDEDYYGWLYSKTVPTHKMAYARRGSYKPRSKPRARVARKSNPKYDKRRVGDSTRAVPRMVGRGYKSMAELHTLDFVALNAGSVGTAWTTLPLCDCPTQGSTQNDRFGNAINIRAIECWVIAQGVPDSPTDFYNDMRVVFGFFKAPRGSGAPTASGINGIMDNTTLASPTSPMSLPFRENWSLIKDAEYKLCTYSTAAPPYTTIGSGSDGRNFIQTRHYVWKFGKGKVAKMQAAAGSAGDWETNIPFLCYGSDSGAISHPTLTIRTRLYFEP